MLLGTFLFSVVRWWYTTLKIVFLDPGMIFKVAFLWFCLSFAASYIFFLIVHKVGVLRVRKALAIALAKSVALSFIFASVLVALYEFVLQNLICSKFFIAHQSCLQNLSLVQHDPQVLYQRLCFLTVMLSGLFAAHFVGEILDNWYESYISDRYGWSIMAATLLCWGFLCVVNYII